MSITHEQDSAARRLDYGAPWLAVFPSLAIMLTVAAVNLFGDWLNDWRERRVMR